MLHYVSSSEEKKLLTDEYKVNGEGCFIFEVQHPVTGQWWCLDATRAFGTTGRLINHSSKKGNLKTLAAVVEGKLRLGFLASRDITAGEELLYDYGCQKRAPLRLRRRVPSATSAGTSIEEV